MVVPNDDWTLPPPPELIYLCCDELLVLDWVLCAASGLVHEDSDPAFGWHETRLECWRQIIGLGEDKTSLKALPLTPRDAKTLLRAVPTTLTWGDGVDHGFNLKMKLAKFQLGEDYAADNSTDQAAASDPPDEAPGAAPA